MTILVIDPQRVQWFFTRPVQSMRSLCPMCDVQLGEGVQIEPGWDLVWQLAPDYEVDRQVYW